MAAKKKSNEAEEAVRTEEPSPIDFSAYLPVGFDPAELKRVGGFVPLVPAEFAYGHGIVIAGWGLGIVDMPQRESLNKKGEKEDWSTLEIELTAPCEGVSGDEVVPMAAGDHVMIPMNGSLRNNAGLGRALIHPTNEYLCVIRVIGQRNTGKPTDMWDYEVFIHPKYRKRAALALKSPERPAELPAAAAESESNGAHPG